MRYYKQTSNGYIVAIGTGNGGVEITQIEYDNIMFSIKNKPPATNNNDYRLKENLAWESYHIEQIEQNDQDIDDTDKSEAYDIIVGETP